MLTHFKNIGRLSKIIWRLGRENALFVDDIKKIAPFSGKIASLISNKKAEGRPGQRLARALVKCGPSFIKLGQALSCRSDLLGEEIAADLAELQDRLPPFSGKEARARIEQEFGCKIEDLFESFDDQAIAAASIAQVHKARTKPSSASPYGKDVAVKILRPQIRQAFRQDIELMYWLAKIALTFMPKLKRLRPIEVVAKFEETSFQEMDLRLEAAAACELAENFTTDATFHVPEIDWQRTSEAVLTMEWVSGLRINQPEDFINTGLNPKLVLKNAAAVFFQQVFRDGFFHADMHPGNVFIQPDGSVTALDFGIMGRISKANRNFLADMLMGFLEGDYRRVADIHFDAGWVPKDQDRDAFMQAVRAIGQPLMDRPLEEISIARLLAQLFQVTEKFNMQTQPQLLLLQKSMLTAEGMGRALDPTVNMWAVIRPLIEAWMIANRGPQARILEHVQDFNTLIMSLPRTMERIEHFTETIERDGVKLNRHEAASPKPWLWIFTCLGLASYCAYLLYVTN